MTNDFEFKIGARVFRGRGAFGLVAFALLLLFRAILVLSVVVATKPRVNEAFDQVQIWIGSLLPPGF